MLVALVCVALARAAGSSADIEIVNPSFGQGALPGVDGSWAGLPGSVRAGVLAQYSRDLLVYREGETELGAAVGERLTGQFGVSWEISRRVGAYAFLPVATQWGAADVPSSAVGSGLGDLGAGLRVTVFAPRGAHWNAGLALRGGVRLPSGTSNAYLGEDAVRGSFGPGFSFSVGRVDVLTGAALNGRRVVATADDLTFGTELSGDAGVRVNVLPKRFSVYAAAVGRMGISAGANNGSMPAEALLGVQWSPIDTVSIDVGAGRGLTAGYGSDRFRGLLGLTYRHVPSADVLVEAEVKERLPVLPDDDLFDAADKPDVGDGVVATPPAEPTWERGELARVERAQIVIRDPIQFERATAGILPTSRPMLDAIAQRLIEHAEISQVVIEGHSSEEGDFTFNYELSMLRATAVCRALVEAGVDAQRLSIRGLGEVVPVSGDAAASGDAAVNRRVVFHIVERAQGSPPGGVATPVPWTGAAPIDRTGGNK